MTTYSQKTTEGVTYYSYVVSYNAQFVLLSTHQHCLFQTKIFRTAFGAGKKGTKRNQKC